MQKMNPFPGMNPFLLRRWRDVDLALIAEVRGELGVELPGDYSAQAEAQIEVLGKPKPQGYVADIAISEDSWHDGHPPVWRPEPSVGGDTLVDKPVIVDVEAPPERWVEIRHDDGTLVTVIEIVSPTNRGGGRLAFLTKRRDYLDAGVNVVEIDLLREGSRLIEMDEERYGERFRTAEHTTVLTIRATMPTRWEIYPCPLRQLLPCIGVPLRFPDPDVALNLQKLIDRIYTSGRYWKLDFAEPLEPRLSPEDEAWVAERLRAVGLLPEV